MSRKTLRELGWDVRRIRLVLRKSEWEHLDAEAYRLGTSPTDIIAGDLGMFIREQKAVARYTLTPEGEKVADEPHADRVADKLGTGGAEW